MTTTNNQQKIRMGQALTLPYELWCPRCGIHPRHQDGFNSTIHTLKPLCPVCQDEERREKLLSRVEYDEAAPIAKRLLDARGNE